MHHSDSERRRAAFVTCYVDESSTDDKVLPDGVLGAFVTNKSGFTAFDPEWSDLLERHRIESPLHMNEFGQHGRFKDFDVCQRECLAREAVDLIKKFRVATFTVALGNRVFEECIDPVFREAYSVYAMAFVALVVINHKAAESQGFSEPIAYMFDEGNSKKHHVLRAHSKLREAGEAFGDLRLGTLAFEHDTFVTALQVGDMLAWTKRRTLAGLRLPRGFESLLELFEPINHQDVDVTADMLRPINAALRTRLARESGEAAV